MDKKQILFLNWRDPKHPSAGGAETYLWKIAAGLVKEGHIIIFFTSKHAGCKDQEKIDDVTIIRRGNKITLYFYALIYLLTNRYYDVVFDGINTVPFFTPIIYPKKSISVIFQITGDVFKQFFPFPFYYLLIWFEQFIYRYIYIRSDVLVLSQSIKDVLVGIGYNPDRIVVSEPGIDHDVYFPGKKSGNPSILFMNRITPYKNAHHLVLSAKSIVTKIPDLRVTIAGFRWMNDYDFYIRNLVSQFNLEDNVYLMDFVDGDQKVSLLQEHWIHVLPSQREGWGISVIEAAACKTPTIGYNTLGLSSSVVNNKTGILVPIKDLDGLTEAILYLLTNDEIRNIYSVNSYQYSIKFTWERTINIVNRMIEKRCNKR